MIIKRTSTVKQSNFQQRSAPTSNSASDLLWIPSLYFAEGVPYFIVNNISVVMLSQMGVSNGQMSLFTSLLYLPWFIKPLWSPFVDILKQKRWWILSMQMLMAVAFGLLAFSIPHPTLEQISSGNTPISLFWLSLILFIVVAFASATHDIAADGYYMLALDKTRQAGYVGFRSVFYRLSNVFCNSLLIYIVGVLENRNVSIPTAWKIIILAMAGLFGILALYHTFTLPKVEKAESASATAKEVFREFLRTITTFFKKAHIGLAILFMLLYRLPEAFMLKLAQPFLIGKQETGGLALSLEQYGIIYGLAGVVCLLVGGIVGGIYIAKKGLSRSLWPMALALTVPCIGYVYLSAFHPTNLYLIAVIIGIEQLGYGFGFTAYMLYMMHFADGEFKTSHYAICTAFMALSMMLPGFVAGYIQEALGYTLFFWFVMVCCSATLVVTYLVRKQLCKEEQ